MKDILDIIKPSSIEKKEVKRLFLKYKALIKIPKTKVILGGSSAKGTFLKGNHDIDIYVKFDRKTYSKQNLSEILEKQIKANTVHGSRDYFQIKDNNYTIEIIPILEIKNTEHAENITDISPFHTKFVLKNKKYLNDIMLTKAFAKANGFYGAESYIQGFSGYSLEILTIYYRGFNNLIKNVSKWGNTVTIDPLKAHKGKVRLNDSKMVSPIILIDPVQSSRNATAVVSQEKYNLFISSSIKYIQKPRKDFFIIKEFSLNNISKKGNFITIEINPLKGKKDIVGSKILKVFEYLSLELKKNDFKILNEGWNFNNKTILFFDIDKNPLSETIKHKGPPTNNKECFEKFKQTWKNYKVQEENGTSYVIIPRKYKDPKELIKELIHSNYVKEKVKSISLI